MKGVFKKHRISLRQKVIALIFITLAVLTSYALYFTLVTAHHAVEEELIEDAQIAVNLISGAISGALWRKEATFLQEFVKQALSGRDIQYIRFVDREGVVLAEGDRGRGHIKHLENEGLSGDLRVTKSLLWTHTMDLVKGTPIVQEVGKAEGLFHRSGHVYYVYTSVVHDGREVGEIRIGINTMEANQRLASATYRVGAIFIVTILIGLLLTFFLERRMRGSLKKLIQTTEHMARGDLSRRVKIDIGDEVEELGESFNRMAQALAEKEREMVMAKNRLVSIFNGITAGISFVSVDYQIIQANRAYEDLLKKISGSSLGNGLRCFDLFWQKQDNCEDCPGKVAMQTGRPEDLEKEVVLKNGERRVLWVHASPVQGPGGKPVGFVEYIIDITKQRKLGDDLKTYTEHLEEIAQSQTLKLKEAQVQIAHQDKMAALGQIAAGVAHEIGNPLSALSSLVRALSIDSGGHFSNGKVKVMKEQIDRISRILREMTDFSRPVSNRKSLTHGNQVIQTALGISRYDSRLKGINVITSLDSEMPALKLDGDQLLQVFLNIIFNAADAMNGEGTLTVTSKLEEDLVIVQFEDTGQGIPEHLLPRVFEPFFTTKEVGKGTGLGLSVSYGIMQNMGGMIKATNRKGGGSVFTVEIPMKNQKVM